MIKELEIVLQPHHLGDDFITKSTIAKTLNVPINELNAYQILKRSVDARSRFPVYRIKLLAFIGEGPTQQAFYNFVEQDVSKSKTAVIIGAGPAGLFAALRMIENGIKPILFERGKDVKERRRDLAKLNKELVVNPESNYCFGEGGAGTYSDGKLYTRSTKRGEVDRILHRLIQHGADPDIAINTRPHIGTNKLPQIIQSLRDRVIECGGEIHFNAKLTDITVQSNRIKSIVINNSDHYDTDTLLLATGHSARDIYELLYHKKIKIESKPFALGVRIEHPQSIIDSAQYHCDVRPDALPPAYYSIVEQVNQKGVFSFCMCPGGIIAPCATSPGEVVVNGWSPSKRNNPYANSGMVVSVNINDYIPFKKSGPLAGIEFQSAVERNCFIAGGGNLVAPAQRVVDFCEGKTSKGLIETSYIPGVSNTQLGEVLPKEITQALRAGIREFGKKIKGYYSNEGVVVGTESRTSSPVRIPRNQETLMHVEVAGLFPCAEGAGYAGGIVSAAMDGEKCADAMHNFISQ